MIGAALALLVIGVIFLFIVPWVGIPLGLVGLILLAAFLLGFGRHSGEPSAS
jgi:hypothetical protein